MAAIVITPDVLKAAKKQLANWYPQASSSAMTEALARGLGYRTNAALRADMMGPSLELEKIRLFEPVPFIERLRELSEGAVPIHNEEQLIDLDVSLGDVENDGIFPTRKRARAQDETLTSSEDLAWQRVMVAAANAGIRQGLFTMRPGANFWPGFREEPLVSGWYSFEARGYPARCRVGGSGEGNLRLDVILLPNKSFTEEHASSGDGGQDARAQDLGEVLAVGWFERTEGAWLQAGPVIGEGIDRLPRLHAFQMERPLGFAPLGIAFL